MTSQPFGSVATCSRGQTHGFASPPRDGFALIGGCRGIDATISRWRPLNSLPWPSFARSLNTANVGCPTGAVKWVTPFFSHFRRESVVTACEFAACEFGRGAGILAYPAAEPL